MGRESLEDVLNLHRCVDVASQDAMLKAQEVEAKLAEEERVCNDSTVALWEECKPCLKNICVKYYSRTCSSGSGMVGHQVRTPSPPGA